MIINSGLIQKIATISFQDFSRTKLNFQGPPTRNVNSQMVHKCTFPVQANRFQGSDENNMVKASSVCFMSFSTFISSLVFSLYLLLLYPCFTVEKKKSRQSNLLLTPPPLKLKKIQGFFKNSHRNLRTFQGKLEFKDFSSTPPEIQGLFKTVRTL